jgi:hypothetical protein
MPVPRRSKRAAVSKVVSTPPLVALRRASPMRSVVPILLKEPAA